jgi:hypothetical protein
VRDRSHRVARKFSSILVAELPVALEWCKPHHRVEKLRCYKTISRAFHKVFQRSVENLTRNCFLLLHFGSDRATTSLTESFLYF